MESLDDSQVIETLKEKTKLLNKILKLTENQNKDIKIDNENEEDNSIEQINEILHEKDLIIEKINDIDLKLKDYDLKEKIQNKELSNLLSQIKQTLKKIKALDDENNKILSEAIKDMGKHLKEVRETKRAMNKYGDSDPYHAFAAQGGTLFIDQDS